MEFVYRAGDHADEMYMINSGKVEYVLEEIVYKTMTSG
jgi:hypothetical protein